MGALYQRAGQRRVERRQGYSAIGRHFGRGAALAEQNDRAEHAVDVGADEQLVRMAVPHYCLHGEAVEACVGSGPTHPRQHLVGSVAHHSRVVQVHRHAADIGRVRNVG